MSKSHTQFFLCPVLICLLYVIYHCSIPLGRSSCRLSEQPPTDSLYSPKTHSLDLQVRVFCMVKMARHYVNPVLGYWLLSPKYWFLRASVLELKSQKQNIQLPKDIITKHINRNCETIFVWFCSRKHIFKKVHWTLFDYIRNKYFCLANYNPDKVSERWQMNYVQNIF